eukprot:7983111-Heterocapsa_arctica.AAC.1
MAFAVKNLSINIQLEQVEEPQDFTYQPWTIFSGTQEETQARLSGLVQYRNKSESNGLNPQFQLGFDS